MDEPVDWGGGVELDEGVLSPGCSALSTMEAIMGDSQPPDSILQSIIPGTDSDMIAALNGMCSPERKIPGKKRKLGSPTPTHVSNNIGHEPTYGGFRDPDFFSTFHNTPASVPCNVNKDAPLNTNVSAFPINNSMTRTILVEPIPGTGNQNNVSKFFSNNVSLAKSIHNSPFKPMLVNTKKNYAKNLLVLTLSGVTDAVLNKLLTIDRLGEWQVKCRLPLMHQICRGVIGPIGIDSDLVELKAIFSENCKEITDIRRIYKGKDKVPTLSVMVTFQSGELPSYMHLYHERFPVRPFVDKPWQCYKCQRFGHNADVCRNKPRCVVCAGEHLLRDCTAKNSGGEGNLETGTVLCANCKKPHTANYGGCAFMLEAKKVEKTRTHNKMSYREALATVREQTSNNKGNSTVPVPTTHNREVSQRQSTKAPLFVPLTKSIGTQTEEERYYENPVKPQSMSINSSFANDLLVMMVKVLAEAKLIPSKKIGEVSSILSARMSLEPNEQTNSETEEVAVVLSTTKKTPTAPSTNYNLPSTSQSMDNLSLPTYDSHANQNDKPCPNTRKRKAKNSKWRTK